MAKGKTVSAKPTKHEENLKFFKELVEEELTKMCKEKLDFDHGEDYYILDFKQCQKHVLKLFAEKFDLFADKAWEIKDLAIANGCPSIFGCQEFYIEGAKKGQLEFIVFDLED